MAKTEIKNLERTYNVPLRREYLKAPNWNRTKKAVSALRQFLSKHMKSTDIRLTNTLNKELWKHGIKNPPHHVKVTVSKDDKGVVMAELFGAKPKVEHSKVVSKVVKTEENKSAKETKSAEESKTEETKPEAAKLKQTEDEQKVKAEKIKKA